MTAACDCDCGRAAVTGPGWTCWSRPRAGPAPGRGPRSWPDPPVQRRYDAAVQHARAVDANPQLARDRHGGSGSCPNRSPSRRWACCYRRRSTRCWPTRTPSSASVPPTRTPAPSSTLEERTYRPGAALARLVRARDGTCRYPGCATPAATLRPGPRHRPPARSHGGSQLAEPVPNPSRVQTPRRLDHHHDPRGRVHLDRAQRTHATPPTPTTCTTTPPNQWTRPIGQAGVTSALAWGLGCCRHAPRRLGAVPRRTGPSTWKVMEHRDRSCRHQWLWPYRPQLLPGRAGDGCRRADRRRQRPHGHQADLPPAQVRLRPWRAQGRRLGGRELDQRRRQADEGLRREGPGCHRVGRRRRRHRHRVDRPLHRRDQGQGAHRRRRQEGHHLRSGEERGRHLRHGRQPRDATTRRATTWSPTPPARPTAWLRWPRRCTTS